MDKELYVVPLTGILSLLEHFFLHLALRSSPSVSIYVLRRSVLHSLLGWLFGNGLQPVLQRLAVRAVTL